MRTQLRYLGLILIGLAAWGVDAPSARGAFVASLTVDVALEWDGSHLYTYTLAVAAESTAPAVQFDLAVGEAADLQGLAAPAGWGFDYAVGSPAVSFFVEDVPGEIAPGGSGVFSFRSRLEPTAQDYYLVGFSQGIEVLQGSILAPAVPEPSSLALLALGAVGSGLAVSRRSRRPSA